MSTRLRYMAWLLGALTITGLAAFAAGRIRRGYEESNGRLEIAASDLDMGEVWSQGDFHHDLKITNTSSKRLRCRLIADCSCTRISPSEFDIASGESLPLRLTVDLRSDRSLSLPGSFRRFSTAIKAETADTGAPPSAWQVTASVRDPFSKYERLMELSWVADYEDRSPPTHFEFACNEPGMTCDFDLRQPIVVLQTRQDAESPLTLRLQCTPKEGLSVGTHGSPLTIRPRLSDGTALASIEAWISVTVQSDIEMTPSIMSLGTLSQAEKHSVNSELTIRSRTLRDIDAPRLAFIDSDHFCTISLTGAPRRKSVSEWTVPILIDLNGAGPHVERIPVTIQTAAEQYSSHVTVSWVAPPGDDALKSAAASERIQ